MLIGAGLDTFNKIQYIAIVNEVFRDLPEFDWHL